MALDLLRGGDYHIYRNPQPAHRWQGLAQLFITTNAEVGGGDVHLLAVFTGEQGIQDGGQLVRVDVTDTIKQSVANYPTVGDRLP